MLQEVFYLSDIYKKNSGKKLKCFNPDMFVIVYHKQWVCIIVYKCGGVRFYVHRYHSLPYGISDEATVVGITILRCQSIPSHHEIKPLGYTLYDCYS